jgi:cytochrome P450 family 6
MRGLDPQVSKYFRRMVQDTINYREKNNVKRNDFLQLLIQIKNEGKVEEEHSNPEQNDHGNKKNKSGESGMYLSRVLYVINIFILAPRGVQLNFGS